MPDEDCSSSKCQELEDHYESLGDDPLADGCQREGNLGWKANNGGPTGSCIEPYNLVIDPATKKWNEENGQTLHQIHAKYDGCCIGMTGALVVFSKEACLRFVTLYMLGQITPLGLGAADWGYSWMDQLSMLRIFSQGTANFIWIELAGRLCDIVTEITLTLFFTNIHLRHTDPGTEVIEFF